MKFYISARPLRHEGMLITPNEHLKYNFQGVEMTAQCIAYNPIVDGRMLYEIVLSDNYSEGQQSELQAIIIEGMAGFGGHLKSLESAQSLAMSITRDEWIIEGGSLAPVRPKGD